MASHRTSSLRALIQPSIVDLTAVLLFASLTTSVVLLAAAESTLRVAFGIPFLLFVPGYALVAAAFPRYGAPASSISPSNRRTIDGVERLALAVAMSVVLLPILGFALSLTRFGFGVVPIFTAVDGFVLVCIAIAIHRRMRLQPQNRFRVPYGRWLAAMRRAMVRSPIDALLNIALAVAIVLTVSSLGYAVTAPMQGEQFTGVSLLAENEAGELEAGSYPTEFAASEGRTLHLEIRNNEGEPVTYTVVVELHRIDSGTVRERESIDRFQTHVTADETVVVNHIIRPKTSGDDLRLTYLVYKGSPPEEPTTDNAYRTLYLWIDVSDPASSNDHQTG